MCIRDRFDRRPRSAAPLPERNGDMEAFFDERTASARQSLSCLLYTSDAADERSSVDLGGRRIIKKKKNSDICGT